MNLLEMSDDQLLAEFKISTLPKWKTLCLLRYLDAHTLNAHLIKDFTASDSELRRKLFDFLMACKTNKVMIRSDMPVETRDYVRGGNSFELEAATQVCRKLIEAGRSVILLEPTDRLNNLASICVHVDYTGRWQGDFLGKGYDVGDLQRGAVVPEFTFKGQNFRRDGPAAHHTSELEIEHVKTVSSEQRQKQRLINIGNNILPPLTGDNSDSYDLKSVAAWLDQAGYKNFFEPKADGIPPSLIQEVIDVTDRVFRFYSREVGFESLVVSCSLLDQHRIVFWDVADGKRKWGDQ